jgi:hypothetical protein
MEVAHEQVYVIFVDHFAFKAVAKRPFPIFTYCLLQLRYACPISQSKHVRLWPEHELSEQRN